MTNIEIMQMAIDALDSKDERLKKQEETIESQSKEIGALRKQVHDYDGKLQDQKDLIEKQSKEIEELEKAITDFKYDHFHQVKPIPLTEEWLIKLGFNKSGEYFSISQYDIDYCFKYADFRKDWGFYIEYTDSPAERDDGVKYPVSFGIKYVHQLQNLYHALTGEELTIKEQ